MSQRTSTRDRTAWLETTYGRFRQRKRHDLFMSMAVYCFHNQPMEGYYFEFGCHRARTMRLAHDAFDVLFDFTYVAFDSFEGMPEIEAVDAMPIWKKGAACTSEEDFRRIVHDHGILPERLVTVKGFYEDSLTPALKERLLPTRAAVIYVDCDLYTSTVPVLDFAKSFLQKGTILVFDDWFCHYGDPERGERRAFREFRERHPRLRFEPFTQTSEAQAFVFLGGNEED